MNQSEPNRDSLDSLIAYCQKDNRICPMPDKWNELYQMLPETRRVGRGFEPALPLILAAWYEASDSMKRERLSDHLRWASDHQALDVVGKFLRSLPEEQWHHLRE